ncbi:MAG: SMI1/KNR4 family protein [Eubacteriales bacterium]|nr:SMI1/KNR4 family protein [Eubacteriales bacterium]
MIATGASDLVKKYVDGLKQAFYANGGKEEWDEFEGVKEGASQENILKLKELYPEIPDSLVEMLKYADGTYFREYRGVNIALYFLGSDLEEYPYYLLSSGEMIKNQALAQEWYGDYINREFDPEDIPIDDKIIDDADKMKWLHFSDCMNNGGSSQLFIDFSPSEKGKNGQVVMFVHDSDYIEVIADSFDEYLEKMMNQQFDFIIDEYFG